MDKKHRDILKKNLLQLISDLNGKDAARFLYANSIFSETDKSQIEVITAPQDLNAKLLDLLLGRGPEAYGQFKAFLKANQNHLYDMLLNAEGLKVPSSSDDISPNSASVVINKDVQQTPKPDEKPAKVAAAEKSQEDGDGPNSKGLKVPSSSDDISPNSASVVIKKGVQGTPKPDEKPAKVPAAEKSQEDGEGHNPKDADHSDGNKRSKPDHKASTQTDGVDHSDIYSMINKPRGQAFIINNKIFKPSSGKCPRNGTDIDAEELKKLFESLGFQTEVKHNVSTKETFNLFDSYANMDSSHYDCFMCAVLTHGEEGIINTVDGSEVQIKELTAKFRGKFMGKPKLFFFQACQGFEYMDGSDVTDGAAQEVDEVYAPGSNIITLPLEADFLYAYSTVPGYYSWRNPARGSWFVQAIVSVFSRHKHNMDVLSMMTRVNREVALQKSNTNETFSDNKKQIPCIITQLRKELYFYPENVVGKSSEDNQVEKKDKKCLVF